MVSLSAQSEHQKLLAFLDTITGMPGVYGRSGVGPDDMSFRPPPEKNSVGDGPPK